jgi:hypothetical protein
MARPVLAERTPGLAPERYNVFVVVSEDTGTH